MGFSDAVIYRFDPFTLDTERLELLSGGDPIPVEPQVFAVLAHLIENRDRVVEKDELIEAVWDGRAISDGALNSRIAAARRAVGDNGDAQATIRTYPRRGFRFVGTVAEKPPRKDNGAPAASRSGSPSIAVLPFANLSNDPEQEYFSDGITEDLIAALARVRRFQVIARSSSFSYKGQSPDIRQVARELNARYIIEGSVRKAENAIRLSVHLSDGETGNQVWAARYDRDLGNIFAVQDELSLAVVGAAEPAMAKSEQERAKRKPPESLDAWEAYHQGMANLHRHTEDGTSAARKLFERAISLDPQFALAHAGYARTYYWNRLLATSESNREEAENAARVAVELDPEEAETHLALANVCWTNQDLEHALPECEAAVNLNPSYAAAYHLLATVLIHSGRPADALPHLFRAIELSPKDSEVGIFHARLALAYLYLREHEQAVDWAQQAIRLPGIQWPAHCYLVSALAHLGRIDEAKKALAGLYAFRPGITAQFIRERLPQAVPENFKHLYDGLLKTGLPD